MSNTAGPFSGSRQTINRLVKRSVEYYELLNVPLRKLCRIAVQKQDDELFLAFMQKCPVESIFSPLFEGDDSDSYCIMEYLIAAEQRGLLH